MLHDSRLRPARREADQCLQAGLRASRRMCTPGEQSTTLNKECLQSHHTRKVLNVTNSMFNSALVIAIIIALGFCLVVGVITVMRWPWQHRRVLPGGAEQMAYQLGSLTGRQLNAVSFATRAAIDAKGHATWADVQTGVATARSVCPATQD